MCSMTNGNRLPPAHQPSGIIPAQRPACPPETAAPRRRPAGARPDGSAEQPAPVQAERQASGRAGTTEQERSRQAAARAATAPPSHTTSRQPRPADQPRPAGDRAADPIQPSPSARSDPVRESRGGEEEREREERRGHRCKFPAQVIICRTRRPTAQGRPSRSDPAPAPPESNRNRPPCCASILLLERMQNQRPRNPRRATGDSPARQQ